MKSIKANKKKKPSAKNSQRVKAKTTRPGSTPRVSRYNHKKIEAKWQKRWLATKAYEPDFDKARRPLFNLMMFPYPSAEGLHIGNMYAFTGSDIYGRFKRLQGYDVFEPIGLDGFGIHSENYALKIGAHPVKQAKVSQKRFYGQLQMVGNSFAWQEHLETYAPEYYRWTQWLFTQLFKHNLAYRKKQEVNWCPSCKTVLADEQVISGKCERCSSTVTKRELEQWFFRITKYADRLLKNLDKLDWSQKVKIAQAEWIGKSEGYAVQFPLVNSKLAVEVFTTRLDTLFGATYLVLAPEHPFLKGQQLEIQNWPEVKRYLEESLVKPDEERTILNKEKSGVILHGVEAINPATKKRIPVFVADYVLEGYGSSAIMGVPGHDQRDFDFAQRFSLEVIEVVSQDGKGHGILKEPYLGEGVLINSGPFDRLPHKEAQSKIANFVGAAKTVHFHLRDWLISRQRYWGPPIPMVYCEKCGWQTIKEKDLPLLLPNIKNFQPTGTGEAPLATDKEFYETSCPLCKAKARRETDVSDTFLDSAWYYLGYLMAAKKWKLGFSDKSFQALVKKWLPINTYIGGAEHSVLHLLYIRFIAMVLHDLGYLPFEEPVKKFRAHGLIIKDGAKMSKSKGNVINPDEYIRQYGADTIRMYLMFLAPLEQGGDFRDEGINGITRFLQRVWNFYSKNFGKKSVIKAKPSPQLSQLYHQTVKRVEEDLESLHYNTATSSLMVLFNAMEVRLKECSSEISRGFLQMLHPLAPHLTSELFQQLTKTDIGKQGWPKYSAKLLEQKITVYAVQVNGKTRATLKLKANTEQEAVISSAKKLASVAKWLDAKKVRKVIFVKNKIVNFVL